MGGTLQVSQHSRGEGRNPSSGGGGEGGPIEEFRGPRLKQYGGAGLLRRFVRRVGLAERLAGVTVAYVGRRYGVVDYLMALIMGLLLGLQRQVELAGLRQDRAAMMALGLQGMPSQPSWSRFLAGCGGWASHKLRTLNRRLVREMRHGFRSATIDLDTQVIVTRGHPERADRGYNPKRRDSKSYVAYMAFVGETRDALDARLCRGSEATVSAVGAWQTFRDGRRALPSDLRRVRLRADSAFYSDAFLSRLEGEGVSYFIAVPLYQSLKRRLGGLRFRRLDNKWATSELEYRPSRRGHTRRVVVIRERLDPTEPRKKQLQLLDCPGYAYQCIVTNTAWSCERVWRFYNHRCCVENMIKETQQDLGGNHILSRWYAGNALWLAASLLAYNLWNWFRERILNQHAHRHTIRYWRKRLIELPARLVYSARRYRLKLGADHPEKLLFQRALARLNAL